jgi:hypothetical protein
MSEPRPAASGEPSAQPAAPAGSPTPGTGEARSLPVAVPADVLGLNGLAPTDDNPTIISRNPPRTPAGDAGNAADIRGRRLAHFELIEPVGVGGMAAVIRARDLQLDRLVALKILPPDMAQDPENIRRFHQEARAAARLDHENIARVYYCGEDQQLHFIAFEFVEGDNLRTILERRGRLPVAEALHYALQVAAGLAHAARRGVVHRDIKPSNIIITPVGRAKLVDMGLARSLGPQGDDGLTQSGVTLGTFDYISPEQALEPRDADVRSDVYSLGCTLYHMITGQAPVPEGTAARKLHHHHHVRPPDPRQFVPDLPDAVALILDRMMAKRPADRYQTPEQLVHDLLTAARRVGAAPLVPDELLTLDASVPAPPMGRPLLMFALAVCAVVVLIFLVGQPAPKTTRPANAGSELVSADPAGRLPEGNTPAEGGSGASAKPPAAGDKPRGEGPAVPAAGTADKARTQRPTDRVARYDNPSPTAEDLAAWLEEHKGAPRIEILLAGDIDLSSRDGRSEQGLVIRNPEVTIRPLSPAARPTVRFVYDSLPYGKGATAVRASLTLLGQQHSHVQGLRFVVDGRGSKTAMTGLWFRGGRRHEVRDCAFIQVQPSFDADARMASVRVDADGATPSLALRGSSFLGFASSRPSVTASAADDTSTVPADVARGGQDAVAQTGAARVDARDCAFGPHASVFRLERADLFLRNCSVMAAGPSAVFDLGPGANARINAARSVFARTGSGAGTGTSADGGMTAMTGSRRVVLVHQAPSVAGVCPYQGQDNRYYDLDAFLEVGDNVECSTWGELRDRLAGSGQKDDSRELRSAPWSAADPLALLEKEDVAAGFHPDSSQADLRVRREGSEHLVGVERLASADFGKDLPPLAPPKPVPAQGRTLVVEPGRRDPAVGVYPSLEHVLPDLRPGDVVLLRHDGELRLDPVGLSKKELGDVTIRPYPRHHPVLTLSEAAGGEPDAALFRLHDGRLTLEDLEVRLRPARDEFEAQAVVALAGDGQFALRNCVVTLDRAGRKAALAVATLPDPGRRMMDVGMAPARPHDQGPHLILERCFVRGEGDLFWARASRPAEVEMRNSLVVVTGSLLNVEAAREVLATGTMAVTLDRVTTCLAGNLLRVRTGKDLKALTPLECRPSGCLFMPSAPSGDRVLVHLEGPESDETALKDKVRWVGGPNAYGGFNCLLNFQAPEEGKMPQPSTLEGWKKYSGDTDGSYRNVDLAAPPLAPFTQVLPADFRPGDGVKAGMGADVAELPRPRGEPLGPLLPDE